MPVRPIPRQTLACGPFEWVHVSRNLPQDIEYLRSRFEFHPIDLRDTLPPLQRHKLVVRERYIFLILLFPVFDRKTRIVSSVELDCFIEPQRIVTVNNGTLPIIQQVFDEYKRDRDERERCFRGGIPQLITALLERLYESLFPMLLHISADIDEVERQLFKADQGDLALEVLRIKTNIVNVRKAMQGHKRVLQAFMQYGGFLFPLRAQKEYIDELVERTKEIWDTVELQRDTINALHETHASLLENRTNDIIKTLTMFSVVIFPLTLIATMFAMDVQGIPFRDDPLAFIKVTAILIVLAAVMVVFFKKRRWI